MFNIFVLSDPGEIELEEFRNLFVQWLPIAAMVELMQEILHQLIDGNQQFIPLYHIWHYFELFDMFYLHVLLPCCKVSSIGSMFAKWSSNLERTVLTIGFIG